MRFLALGLIALGLGSGCASMSSYHTARTLPKGKSEIYAAAGFVAGDFNTTETISLPYFEAMFRYGIINNLEAGFKYTMPGTIGADVKYRFLKAANGKLHLAAGTGINFARIFDANYLDFSFPIFISYVPADIVEIYGIPKFVYRTAFGNGASLNEFGIIPLIGTRIGKDIGVAIEAGYYISFMNSIGFFQGGLSVFFKI